MGLLQGLAWATVGIGILSSGCVIEEAVDSEPPAMDGTTWGGEDDLECFVGQLCDPLSASSCDETSACKPDHAEFRCMAAGQGSTPPSQGDNCTGTTACGAGLVCVGAADCSAGHKCCLPLCDLSDPGCGGTLGCVPFYESGGQSSCYEHVGVCVLGG